MNNDVGALLQWPLQHGCAEAVVDHQQSIVFTGDGRQGRKIRHFTQRIGRGFQKQHPGGGANLSLPLIGVRQAHKAGFHAKPGHVLLKQYVGRPKHTSGTDHMVAGLQQRHAGAENGSHT